MRSSIYWIDHIPRFRIGIMARPRSGDWLEDEIQSWRDDRVDLVVSLLEAEEMYDLGLRDEAGLCREAGIAFASFPIPDRGVPDSVGEVLALVARLAGEAARAKSVAIHCRAGIGRSSLIAGTVLVHAGASADAALAAIAQARGLPVPDTDEQRDWLRAFEARIREQ